jgi:hypothetical protein
MAYTYALKVTGVYSQIYETVGRPGEFLNLRRSFKELCPYGGRTKGRNVMKTRQTKAEHIQLTVRQCNVMCGIHSLQRRFCSFTEPASERLTVHVLAPRVC